MKTLLNIENLSIGFDGKKGRKETIRSQITLNADEGELVAVVGANGAGKSTLLRTILGLQKKNLGNIFIKNKNIHEYTKLQLAQIISYVSTETIKYDNLSVNELVSLGRFPYTNWLGTLETSDKEIVEKSLEIIGMKNFIYRYFNGLSDGEKQRVMIARALAQETEIIILDEPTAFLDIQHKYEIIKILKNLTIEHNKLIILSSHDLNVVNKFADKIWLFLKEETLQSAPEDFILNGKYTEIFTGKDIFFNSETGDFTNKKTFRNRVQLKGQNQATKWTKQALERAGFETTLDEMDTKIEIWEEKNSIKWIVKKNGILVESKSIYELLLML